jgi:hypothetical protein
MAVEPDTAPRVRVEPPCSEPNAVSPIELNRQNPRKLTLARVHNNPGGVLLSHTVTRAVPLALEGLTTEFGMGSGMTPPTLPPKNFESSAHDSEGSSPVIVSEIASCV